MNDKQKKLTLEQDPILTQFQIGYSNEAFISNLLLPEITVAKSTGKYPIFGAQALEPLLEEVAYDNPDLPRIKKKGYTYGTYETKYYALEDVVQYKEVEAAADILNLERVQTEELMARLLLGKEKHVCDLLQNPATYPVGSKEALSGNDMWDAYSTSDPIKQIKDAILTIRHKTGSYPDKLVLSREAYNALTEHPKIIAKIQYSQMALVGTDLISALISEDAYKVQVILGSGMIKDPASTDEAPTFIDLWTDSALLLKTNGNAASRRSMYDNSFGFTAVLKGYPYMGSEVISYGRMKKIAAFLEYTPVITKANCGYLFTNTTAA